MRYIFSQLLELQNELNLEVDYDKVDKIVDNLLERLEKAVRNFPTRKSYSFSYAYSDKDGFDKLFYQLSQSELDLIVEELKSLGFHNVNIGYDSSSFSPLSIDISWE